MSEERMNAAQATFLDNMAKVAKRMELLQAQADLEAARLLASDQIVRIKDTPND